MIINDLNIFGSGARPNETAAELIVHANAVLSGTIPNQRFQTIAWRYAKVVEPPSDLQLPKLASRDRL
jgi:hypothetical protein